MQTRRTMAMLVVAALLPAVAAAQQDTTQRDTTRGNRDRQSQGDTTRNRMDAQGRRDTADEGRRIRGESRGSVAARGRASLGLTRTQVTMLQQALREDGCDPGAIDGLVGPRTRRAIACAYERNDLDGRNLNELFRALDLSITVDDSLGVGAAMRSGAGDRARTGRETDANRDRTRDRAVDRDSGRVDSLHQQRPTRDTAQTTERPPAR